MLLVGIAPLLVRGSRGVSMPGWRVSGDVGGRSAAGRRPVGLVGVVGGRSVGLVGVSSSFSSPANFAKILCICKGVFETFETFTLSKILVPVLYVGRVLSPLTTFSRPT